MTETEARQVLLLQAHEAGRGVGDQVPGTQGMPGTPGMPGPHWSLQDRAWATRQAVATVGEQATPERFVVARAVVALQRLLPRDQAAQRWLARRGWHPAWVLLAAVLGAMAGLLADQLGPPQRVNLLAPAVWAVVAWNLLVYAALLLTKPMPVPMAGLRAWLSRWGQGADSAAGTLWWRHAGPLMAERTALVLHTAAAALALGLVAGLYLRGLVLDYRAGWQSTFLDAPAVQQGLGLLLAPASWFTGITLPDVAPLRVGPGADAKASAAPWMHLYAATLALFVVLPRMLLAWRAGWRAGQGARQFPLPLDTPYFENLHPLMRPGLPRAVRLLWVCEQPAVTLLGQTVGALQTPLTLLTSDEGDALELLPTPPATIAAATATATAAAAAVVANVNTWWQRWRAPRDATAQTWARLRQQADAVLLVTTAGTPRPPWLASFDKPVLVLVDGPVAEAPALGLHALADGWLPDGRFLHALTMLLPGDPRLVRLAATWQARQQARFDATVAELAQTLAQMACSHSPLADGGVLLSRRSEADAARQALVQALEGEMRAHATRLTTLLGVPDMAPDAPHGVPAAAAALHARVGEGRAALVGGVLSGALAGLKADLLSGGLTMGAGAVAGGVIGALSAAGAARGLNVVRGADRSFVAWDEEALKPITEALLQRCMVLAYALPPDLARQRLLPALAAQQATLATLWRARQRRFDNGGEAAVLAPSLQRPLADALRQALAAARPTNAAETLSPPTPCKP